jgi:hypothetical protein
VETVPTCDGFDSAVRGYGKVYASSSLDPGIVREALGIAQHIGGRLVKAAGAHATPGPRLIAAAKRPRLMLLRRNFPLKQDQRTNFPRHGCQCATGAGAEVRRRRYTLPLA